jgi:hypothetical protein
MRECVQPTIKWDVEEVVLFVCVEELLVVALEAVTGVRDTRTEVLERAEDARPCAFHGHHLTQRRTQAVNPKGKRHDILE